MAQGRRVERLASLIRREISELVSTGIRDARVHQGMLSITRVDVAGDLQHCKIFVSVYGSEEQQRQALDGLKAATPYVRGELGRRLRLRRMPELIFVLDRGLERGTAVLGLLQELERERRNREEGASTPLEEEPTSLVAQTPESAPFNVDASQRPGD
ncbi:MAG: 30S ribosome-binding factor RbfA [Cyanobacteriota bacterium]|nr:30S ribosome-binding factor RbfA [Cyanobacteriota bacterium]